jgi:hypothetical protein
MLVLEYFWDKFITGVMMELMLLFTFSMSFALQFRTITSFSHSPLSLFSPGVTIFCIVAPGLMSPVADNYSVQKFTDLLSYENWGGIFQENNVNLSFNSFLNTYLRIFHTSFLIKRIPKSIKPKPWLTTGIRNSCANKRKIL